MKLFKSRINILKTTFAFGKYRPKKLKSYKFTPCERSDTSGLQANLGFSLIEILTVIAILTILSTIIWSALAGFNKNKALDRMATEAVSTLEKARSLTLAAKNNIAYGVHFQSDRIILFEGDTFSSIDPNNEETVLNSLVTISDIMISGDGDDIVFDRLTGKTSQDGTVTFSLVSDSSATTTINISSTGIID